MADYLSQFLVQKDEVKKLEIPREIKCRPMQVLDVGFFPEGDQYLVHI